MVQKPLLFSCLVLLMIEIMKTTTWMWFFKAPYLHTVRNHISPPYSQLTLLKIVKWMSISIPSSSSLDSLFIWCLITKSAVSKGDWCHSWLCLFILCCSIHKSKQIDFSCFKKCMVIFLDSIKCTENISMKKLVSAVALILVFCRIKYFISLNGH